VLNKRLYQKLILLSILVIAANCSVEKNTRVSRTYHNITAKYNVGFNGRESFLKGIEKVESDFTDDYSKILPVFYYKNREAFDAAASEMDRTIDKCTKLISLHSITAKPKVKDNKNLNQKQRDFLSKKEYNLYVDDAYLLLGKSHFYKHEFEQAEAFFRLILNDFKNQAITFDGQLWLAKLLIETNRQNDAADILMQLENDTGFPKKLQSDLYATRADLELLRNDYGKSILYLEKALQTVKPKRLRTRYTYILAQLYEKTGDLKRCSDYYGMVISMNPKYEMAFNARINRALAYEQGFGYVKDIEDELLKMLKDDKNNDLQDQIYFALGNLAAKEGNKNEALQYYKQSILVNKNNDQQKARSYLIIADLYYDVPDYPDAQTYYDSTLVYLKTDYPDYNILLSKSQSLTRLVEDINTVKTSDSLIALAGLPKDVLLARIDAVIEEVRKNDEIARQKQQEELLNRQFQNEILERNRVQQQSTTESSKWYFYNDAAKSLGYNEFKLKWGNRRLEDHWQRTEKTAVNFTAGNTDLAERETADTVTPEITMSKYSRDFYLVHIPQTDSAIAELYKKVEMALYDQGLIYKNDLRDFERANESFKELIKRFPESAFRLLAYYSLYTIAKDQNNLPMVEYYSNIIIRQFPESTYAKVLSNPDYFKEIEEEEKLVSGYYEATYLAFSGENYSEVISRCDYALTNYKDSPFIPQFEYLKILSTAKTDDRSKLRDKLLSFITKYPDTEIAADAKNIVNYIDNENPEIRISSETNQSKILFNDSADEPHYFIYFLNKAIGTNQLVFNLINFNLDYYDNLNLVVEIESLNTSQNMVLVRVFRNKSQVMIYLNKIRNSDEILKDMPGTNLTPVAISESNLRILKSEKSADRYLLFFNEYYQ